MIRIFNSLTNSKEPFVPLRPPQVGMYVCGVTVYDDCHLGHARSAVVFDMVRNYLSVSGYHVTYAKNFTDIDDKIIQRAAKEGISWVEVVTKYIAAYRRDMNRLGVAPADIEPKATDHLPQIIRMIQTLIDREYAYDLDGDVYFNVNAYKPYGRLSGRRLEDLMAGARVEVDERKRDPMDFALWKKAKPGEPAWPSPWGAGRPGWHIECSAMSIHHLGETFDIHGGGKDLIFPHHENEIAQSCASTGQEFAKYWVHNGFVTVDQEKMSKSLGNFFTIQEIFEKSQWPEPVMAEVLRYFLLSTHYRSDVNFSDKALLESKSALDNLYDLLQRLEESSPTVQVALPVDLELRLREFKEGFTQAMDDDLNTPKALAEFHGLRSDVNKMISVGISDQDKQGIIQSIRKYGKPLGLFQLPLKSWKFSSILLQGSAKLSISATATLTVEEDDEWIEKQITRREEARKRKDFATADHIRRDLAARGIILEDRPDGTTRWKR